MAGKVLVVGGTGMMGSLVVDELLRRGADVRALVREEKRGASLPVEVERFVGDLRDDDALARSLKGVQSAFYVSPHEPDEIELATSFIYATENAGTRLVFAGVHQRDPQARAALSENLPSYRGKLKIGGLIADSSASPVAFTISNWNQNDEVFKEDILGGRYPMSIKGANRLDLRDVAEASAKALTDLDFRSGSYVLSGPSTFSGAEAAQLWSEALGRPVAYTGEGNGAWREAFARRLSGQKLEDWYHSFELLEVMEWPTVAATVEETTEVLGHAPRDYPAYVRETAKIWH